MVESGSRLGVENKKELKNSSPETIFGVDSDFDEHIGQLEEASSANDLDSSVELLSRKQFTENIVIKKGKNKESLRLFEQSINGIVQVEVGKNVNSISDKEELERIIKSAKLSPFAVAEFAGALYHLDREDECEKLAKLLTIADVSAVDRITKANAFNVLGSLYLRQGAVAGSIDAHKAGLAVLANEKAEDNNVQWQTNKLKYGILVSKMARKVFPDMPDQFFALRRDREELGDIFNIGRTDLDAARAFAALKKQEQAIHFAERGRELMSEAGYWSGAEQATKLLEQLKRTK